MSEREHYSYIFPETISPLSQISEVEWFLRFHFKFHHNIMCHDWPDGRMVWWFIYNIYYTPSVSVSYNNYIPVHWTVIYRKVALEGSSRVRVSDDVMVLTQTFTWHPLPPPALVFIIQVMSVWLNKTKCVIQLLVLLIHSFSVIHAFESTRTVSDRGDVAVRKA